MPKLLKYKSEWIETITSWMERDLSARELPDRQNNKKDVSCARELDVSTCLICLLTGLTDFSNCNSRVWLKANNNRLSFLKLPDFVPRLKTYPRTFLTTDSVGTSPQQIYFITIRNVRVKQNKVWGTITMRFIKLLVKIARTWIRIKLSSFCWKIYQNMK